MLICNVVGARPNFMKMAPVVAELKRRGLPQILVHTGQHYDAAMSQAFFTQLGMPEPDINLGVGSDTHAKQTARVMVALETLCQERQPSMVIVAGDVDMRPTRWLDMPSSDCFSFAEEGGMIETMADLGEPVEKGAVIARIHGIGRTGGEPRDVRAGLSGLLAARHFPGLVKAGDCVSVIAVEV